MTSLSVRARPLDRFLARLAAGDPEARISVAAAAAALVIAVTYFPLIFYRYGLYDDYYNGSRPLASLWKVNLSGGRPISGLLDVLGFGLTRHIDGFGLLRATCIALLAAQAAGLTWILATRTSRTWLAAAVAVLAHSTVGVQIVSAWGATLFVAPVGSMLAGFGGYLLWERHSSTRRGLLGAVLVVAGLATYQPSGMASVIVVVILVAVDERVGVALIRHLAVTLAWLATAFVVTLLLWRVCQLLVPTTGARNDLTNDLSAKWHWLVNGVTGRALRPFSIFLSSWVWSAGIVALLLCAPMSAGTRVSTWAIKSVVILVGLTGAYLPNLAISENWASSRSLWIVWIGIVAIAGVGLIRCVVAVLHMARRRSRYLVTFAVSMMCVAASVNATRNTVNLVAGPNSAELRAVQARMLQAVLLNPPMIVVKAASYLDSIAPAISYDEFGFPAAAAEWAVFPMVLPVALDNHYTGAIKVTRDPTTIDKPPGTIVIDLGLVLDSINNERATQK